MLRVNNKIIIKDWEIKETFVHSSGPGGQKVNKVNSRVLLKFEAQKSLSLSTKTKTRLKIVAGQKWSKEGCVVIHCDSTRSQPRNRTIARKKLTELIKSALIKPKGRILTRPTQANKRKRLAAKRKRGEIKITRSLAKKGAWQFY